jgi:hypothetical protein
VKNKAGAEKGGEVPSIVKMPWRLLSGVTGKVDGLWHSYRLTRHKNNLPLHLDSQFAQNLAGLLDPSAEVDLHASQAEERLCAEIEKETERFNLNNVTRTMAYWTIYKAYPELHWAFLAHLVSRNGGWSMTDLQGQWLPHLLSEQRIEAIFDLLEACNSLIFGDAYPQLRLYAECKRTGRDLFYLLPRFGVSAFMSPFWDKFLSDGNPIPLTAALIINEQHFIQSRVVEDDRYRSEVFASFAFRSQPLLQLNQILFPLRRANRAGKRSPLRLAGRVLENFEDLRERIEFGKSLYGMLFGYPDVLQGAILFAEQTVHTGSRADYWPHRFNPHSMTKAGGKSELSDMAAGLSISSSWLSPSLPDAWPNRPIMKPKKEDWFRGLDSLSYLKPIKLPRVIDMTHEHLLGQNKLQTAVLLERSFMNGASKRRTGRG